MDVIVDPLIRLANYLDEKSDPRLKGFFLMDSPLGIIAIIAVYYHFIKYSGPKLMEKRKPYDLKQIMIYYNILQCMVNGWATYQGYKILTHPTMNMLCSPLTYGTSEFELKTTYLSYFYLIVKIVDLLDTIFMVLRKNYHQVTFLHVYHHMGMALGCWIVVKFSPGAHLCLVGFINCFVHTIMYFYYLLTVYDPELKKSIWWKKHITELQMFQFSLIMIHHSIAFFNPSCTYPKIPLVIYITQNMLVFYLFAKFYYGAYIKPNKKKS